MRIGHGYDVHALGSGNHIVVGGVEIEFHKGIIAHSDGDVLIHAVCDALLGGLAQGDIGQHFPDSEPRWENADSREFLRAVVAMVIEEGLEIAHADVTIVAQEPRMAMHIPLMRERMTEDMRIDTSQLNIKATTTEGLGFVGRGEGIEAHAVVILREG
ncbi:MAG: 2-C-methyl-D-erythritol 2,4-cyclodiphosphate synthase [Gammaproteobacteria bacterium]